MAFSSRSALAVASRQTRLAARQMLNMLAPPTCLCCENVIAESGLVCARCWNDLHFIDAPVCRVSGMPFGYDLGSEAVSADVLANPPKYDRARAVVLYTDRARQLVSRLKYADDTALAPWMAQWMFQAGRRMMPDILDQLPATACIVPVPLHRGRQIQRRYNQAAELGRQIAKRAGLEFTPDILERHRPTESQVGLGQAARQRNVAGAFRVRPEVAPRLHGRSVILVDDVLTTGATANACARVLKKAGADQVNVLTFARVADGSFDAAL